MLTLIRTCGTVLNLFFGMTMSNLVVYNQFWRLIFRGVCNIWQWGCIDCISKWRDFTSHEICSCNQPNTSSSKRYLRCNGWIGAVHWSISNWCLILEWFAMYHFVSNVFVLTPEGNIYISCFNMRFVHDSKVTDVWNKLERCDHVL